MAPPPQRSSVRCIALVVLVLMSLGGVASAQATPPQAPPVPPPVETLEFDQAIARALAKNPTIAEAATAIARAEALVGQSRALTLPSVSASLRSVTLDGTRGFEGSTTQPQSQLFFGPNVFYQTGNWYGVNQARDQVEVATRSVAEVRQQVAIGAASAYLAIIAARRQVDVAVRSLDAARAHLDYAQKRLEGGAGSRLNQLRAAQAVSVDEGRLETFQLALRRAQEALGVLVVVDGRVDAGAEPVFEVPGDPELAALASSGLICSRRPLSSAPPSAWSAIIGRSGRRFPACHSIRRSSARPGCSSPRSRGR